MWTDEKPLLEWLPLLSPGSSSLPFCHFSSPSSLSSSSSWGRRSAPAGGLGRWGMWTGSYDAADVPHGRARPCGIWACVTDRPNQQPLPVWACRFRLAFSACHGSVMSERFRLSWSFHVLVYARGGVLRQRRGSCGQVTAACGAVGSGRKRWGPGPPFAAPSMAYRKSFLQPFTHTSGPR